MEENVQLKEKKSSVKNLISMFAITAGVTTFILFSFGIVTQMALNGIVLAIVGFGIYYMLYEKKGESISADIPSTSESRAKKEVVEIILDNLVNKKDITEEMILNTITSVERKHDLPQKNQYDLMGCLEDVSLVFQQSSVLHIDEREKYYHHIRDIISDLKNPHGKIDGQLTEIKDIISEIEDLLKEEDESPLNKNINQLKSKINKLKLVRVSKDKINQSRSFIYYINSLFKILLVTLTANFVFIVVVSVLYKLELIKISENFINIPIQNLLLF